jgi:hypothetical protein
VAVVVAVPMVSLPVMMAVVSQAVGNVMFPGVTALTVKMKLIVLLQHVQKQIVDTI